MSAPKIACYAVVTAGLAVALAAPAAAQVRECAPRDQLLGKLHQAFAEEPINVGVTVSGELMEILVAPSGTWTVLISIPGGPTCVATHGDGWRAIEPESEQHVLAPLADRGLSKRAMLLHWREGRMTFPPRGAI